MEFQIFLDLVKKRRSIRNFKPEPVSGELVDAVLEAARFAPSGANSQPWEFVVIQDNKTKQEIVNLFNEANTESKKRELAREDKLPHPMVKRPEGDPSFKDAPVFIIVCGDYRTTWSYPVSSNPEKNFQVSLANAVYSLLLAATTLGLGAQYVTASSSPLMEPKLKALLGIPASYKIHELICLGWPAKGPNERPVKKLEQIIHREKYDAKRLKTDEKMKEFIRAIHEGRIVE